jgi:CDP-6-deoxy-D-xylo-4-hexulose-3-dehydrase
MSDDDELRNLIASRMADLPTAFNADNPRYWYPLATATYGVEEVMQAVESMTTYRTSMWNKTRTFEDQFGSKYSGDAVMVNSGSSADLVLVLSQLAQSGGPLSPGVEVCVPAVTWPTHLWSVLMAGLTPVLVDVDPETLNMSVEDLERKITPRTGAIFPVHLMGNPAPMDRIAGIAESCHAIVLEDCCEALGAMWNGASVGTLGEGGSFSFFFSHHITTMEGGMVLTRNSETAERLRLLRAHGWSRNLRSPEVLPSAGSEDASRLDPRYTFVDWGLNVRPTELQAGFGIEQLKRISQFESQRQRNFDGFVLRMRDADLSDWYSLPTVDERALPSWFALPLMLSESLPYSRDQLTSFLDAHGVETRPIVAGNLARHPVRERFPQVFGGVFEGADLVHNQGFYVGLYPEPMDQLLDRLVGLLSDFHLEHR